MRQSPGGRGGRSNWSRFQQQQHAPRGAAGFAPYGRHQSPQSFQQHQPTYQQPRAAPNAPNTSQVQRDVVAFVEAFRANQSSPAAPPNALTLDVVVRAICSHFRVNAFEELMGIDPLQLPALRQLHTVNQRVWTFVTCFMQSRRVNTLFECQQAFLQHEGLRSFSVLKLGNSFLHTEAVQQLYRSPVAVLTVTTRDVLASLKQFEDLLGHDAFRASSHIDLNEFLQYLAQQYRQPSAQAMGVAIDPAGFGVYVGMLRRVANNEMKEMKTLEQQFQREVAEKMFRLTKEKFSDDNRKQALEELLEQTNARSTQQESEENSQKRRGGKKNNMQSLSLDMLKRVTDVDVYLDNVLRRKAAADAKSQQKFRKPISSQEIAETDSKLRNQMTRFLVASQKSKHHSRLKVVTWVICSIMAKTYALLLSDDKIPDEDADGEGAVDAKKISESDKEECDCCCVGKDTCTCSCTCKCHVESSDEEEEDEDELAKTAKSHEELKSAAISEKFPVMPTDPFARRLAKTAAEPKATLEEVKAEMKSFLESQSPLDDEPRTAKEVLQLLSSLENHLTSKFSAKPNNVSWAGRRSVLELLPDLVDDAEGDMDDDELNAGKWLLGLLRSRGEGSSASSSSGALSEKQLKDEVLPFVRECRAVISSSSALSALSSDKQQQWIARRVCVELGCARVEELGLPSVEELIKLTDEKPAGEEASIIKFTGSLDLVQGDGSFDDTISSNETTGESMQQKLLTEQALEKLRKCPCLVDVSLYMDWRERYAPLCGSLLSFIRVHEMILLDHAPSSNNFMFVSCLNGTILRVNEKSTPSDLELLFAHAQQAKTLVAARHVAIHLVSMMVTCKCEANFPKQLVQAHLRGYLSSITKSKKENSYSSYPERFVLEVLLETPVEFADFIMSLLIGILGQASESGVANERCSADRVWKACRSDAERKALLFVSSRSLSGLWASETEKWCSLHDSSYTTNINNGDAAANDITKTVATTQPPVCITATSDCSGGENEVASIFDASSLEVALTKFSSELSVQDSKDLSPSEKNTNDASCRSFIEDLRKKQFGVGLQIQDEATTSVLRIQQQRLERALKRLSDELYSESTHFVLELLQNADDNAYDDAVVPLGDFTLTADKEIVFYNNERGFSPANIQAICDVGASTKEAVDSEASIGKKGIGFKSVFKVSDNPQVHSNGFHICFHAKNAQHGTGMGYILPYWMDDTAQWKQRRGTTFVLPLNDTSVQRVDDISQSLMAFEPSVLLFLRRIRELRLSDTARQHTLHFLKKEKHLQTNTQIVQLYSQVKKNKNSVEVVQQNWLVVKEKLEPPQLFNRSHPTEIALAFPLTFQGEDSRPPLQEVFAYLPLRSYGFRFILQGDFEIPSSREAITNGSEWNEWLVSKFPKLVRAAVSNYVSSIQMRDSEADADKAIEAISHLLSLLPLENEVQAPFRSIIPEIMRELRQVKWLISVSSAPASAVGGLLMPSELIDCIELTGSEARESTATLLEALSDDVLAATFNKRFLHPALSRSMTALMKSQLRIEQLHSSHLLRVLSLAADKDSIDWTVKILALLAKLWRKDRHSKLLRQELRLIKCFPLQRKGKDNTTKWVSLADTHDSLFVSGAQTNDGSSTREKSFEFYGDLRILDDNFTKVINKSSKLRAFLMNDVGIHVMEDHDLIRHHILPKMAELRSLAEEMNDNTNTDADVGVVIEYGRFLSSHLVSCSKCSLQADVKANMVIATSSRRIVAVDSPSLLVILPSTLKELPQLASWITTQLESTNRNQNSTDIISNEYFADTSSEPLKDKQWKQLLVDVCELPLLLDATSLSSDKRSQAGMEQLLKWIEAEADITMKRSVSTSLAQHLDKHWSTAESVDDDDSSASEDKDEAFTMWRQYCWLEGSDGQFYRSTELWLSSESSLFTSAMVTFSAMKWKNDDFATRVLGMRATPTTDDVLRAISSLSVDPTLMSALEIDQMVRMYSFLWEECQRSDKCRVEITKACTRKLMLFVPAEADAPRRFIGVKSAVWSSTAHNGELVALESLYPKTLSEFFTDVCGVQRKPSVFFLCEMIVGQQYCFTAKHSDSENLKAWKKKMLPLLNALSKKAKKRSLSKTEIKEIKKTLKSTSWLPVRSVGGSCNGLVLCTSKDSPIQATTENERKLQKFLLSVAKEAVPNNSKEHNKRKVGDDLKLVQVEAFADDGDLDALLSIAKISTLTAHLEAEVSLWCKVLSRFTKSSQLDNKKSRKKLMKLLQSVVKTWSSGLTSSSDTTQLQRSDIFPTSDDSLRWASAAHMYINDQTDLSKNDFQQSGQTEQLQVLGLFPWNYFVDNSTSKGDSSEETRVQKFLTEVCGMKSLKAHLQYEVSVLSTQRRASEAFHDKLRSALAIAQRFLIHNHRTLYDQLEHEAIAKLASELQCMLVDGHDGFQVVYRVGASFSLRRGVDASSQCFLDGSSSTLYLQSVTGDEEASAFSPVLMEISRKLFGAEVAASVANLMYLSLLQPSPEMREQWLVETQLLPPLPSSGADKLWVEQVENTTTSSSSGLENADRKRVFEDMEDGEIAAEEAPMKKPYAPVQQNYQAAQNPHFAPLPPSTNFDTPGNREHYGMSMQRLPYPPLPPQPVEGAPFHPPLPPQSPAAGMQSLSLPNTMTKEEREAIGRWGEEYVFNQLKQQHAESKSDQTVEWVNEMEESGLPYDLTVSSAGKVVEYIEVKSTRTMEKGVFEISMNELDQAAIHGSTYSIYRVFNAGNPALCRVIRMKNPVSLVRQRKVQLALVMQ
ncbi:Phosphoserine aminotransferase [Phytophthora cinnamomi]|uniref:Phosphoserine aminotransferase n=1 Tax=Phytophthora cinnamomi TaxID=4785 RepID=UPI003559A91B|nr:Phosphoserine aminotransferase [Phytophthora cinnamomi]